MAAMVMLIFLVASIGDYPLRVPSLIALFAVIACVFSDSLNAIQGNTLKAKA